MRTPGIEQTTMTLEQNNSMCTSASTDRYDYHEGVCSACKKENEQEKREFLEKLGKQGELRAKERSELMRRDYDHRQNIPREQTRVEKAYAEIEKKNKEAREQGAREMRESAERQYRALGMSQRRISQLIWSDEERGEWEQKDEKRLEEQREMQRREKEKEEKRWQ
jgi:hypothetical protein